MLFGVLVLIGDYDSFVVHAVRVNMNEMNEVNVDGMDPRMLILRKMNRSSSDRLFKSHFGCCLATTFGLQVVVELQGPQRRRD